MEVNRQQGEVITHSNYDPMGRLTQQHTQNKQHKTDLIQREYQYDDAGNLSVFKDGIDASNSWEVRYVYDMVDRLKHTEGNLTENFVFDPAGNLLGQQQQGEQQHDQKDQQQPLKEQQTETGKNAKGNRLSFQGDRKFTYDARGNLIREARGKGGKLTTVFTYNLNNQLTSVTKNNQTTTYTYDPLGRRVGKQDSFGSTNYLWAGDQLAQEHRNNIKKTYVYEPESFRPVAMVQDDEIYHYHLDHLGTPRELTNTEGKIVWKAHYKTYGNVALKDVEDVENNIRFQGQYFDEETGLHYNRHRYYDPSVGQFTTQDPIGLLGGVNNYQYAPNPVGWVDPLGLTCKESSNNPSPQGDNNKTSLTPRQLLALSPTLANNMKLMKDQGWEIDYKGAPGGGSYADKGASKIVIDVNTVHNPLELVQTMAHESGHALYTPDAYVPYSNSGLTRQQYIDANVMTDLKDEGEATIMNVIVRQEILNNGGPDIGVAGSQSKAYVEAYNEHYIKGGDRDKAREEIGKIFANNERPSTAPDKTYKEYYAQSFENHYDSDGENP